MAGTVEVTDLEQQGIATPKAETETETEDRAPTASPAAKYVKKETQPEPETEPGDRSPTASSVADDVKKESDDDDDDSDEGPWICVVDEVSEEKKIDEGNHYYSRPISRPITRR